MFSVLQVIAFSILFLRVSAQNSNQTFGWKFRTDFLSTKVQACFSFDLVVFPNPRNETAGNYSGTPPYYMMAFPQGGQPITSLVGVDNDTLKWMPTHPVGTKLVLQVVDSLGDTGGTSGAVFEVVDNTQTTTCVAPTPPTDFTISSNITQEGDPTLTTCQPWRLNINGGVPPYKVILDARNSPVLTNITIPTGDNAVVFINRADPGTVLFAAAVDLTGRWATGTQFVNTQGSTNISCLGFATITTTQSELDQADAQRRAAQNAKRRTSIIAGVVVSLVVLLLIAGGVGGWLYLRKKKAQKEQEAGPDTVPRQFTESGSTGQLLSINHFVSSDPCTSPSPRKSAFSSPGGDAMSSYITTAFDYNESMSGDTSQFSESSQPGAHHHSGPSFANFPATSVRRSGKGSMSEVDTLLNQSHTTSGTGHRPFTPLRPGSMQDMEGGPSAANELIYQHQDAGRVVRELPPPYPVPPASAKGNNRPT